MLSETRRHRFIIAILISAAFIAVSTRESAAERTITAEGQLRTPEGIIIHPDPDPPVRPPIRDVRDVTGPALKIADTAHKIWRQSKDTSQLRLLANRAEELSQAARTVQKLTSRHASRAQVQQTYRQFEHAYRLTERTLNNAPRNVLHRRTHLEWRAIESLRGELDAAISRYLRSGDHDDYSYYHRVEEAVRIHTRAAAELYEQLRLRPVHGHLADDARKLFEGSERLSERVRQRANREQLLREFSRMSHHYRYIAERFDRRDAYVGPGVNEAWRAVSESYQTVRRLLDADGFVRPHSH